MCLFFLISGWGFAQNLNYIHYNTNNSRLPHDIVYRLHQDKDGYIWIGTDDGLVRFDGVEMLNYEKGFSSRYAIASDEEHGRIWVGSWKGGIYYLDEDSAILVRAVPDYHMADHCNNLLVYNSLVISYNFDCYAVFRFDEKAGILVPSQIRKGAATKLVSSPGDKEYYRFLKTTHHVLLAYDHTGIYKVRNGQLSLLSDRICADELWESPQGEMYYRIGTQVFLTDDHFSISELVYTFSPELIAGRRITSFKVLPSGNICVGLTTNPKRNATVVYYLLNVRTGEIFDLLKEVKAGSTAADVLVDREGGLWLSTDGNGLYHIYDKKYRMIGGAGMQGNATVTSLFAYPDGTLFIGTKKGVHTYREGKLSGFDVLSKDYYVRRFFMMPGGGLGASERSGGYPAGYHIYPGEVQALAYEEQRVFPHYLYERTTARTSSLLRRNGKNGQKIALPDGTIDVEEDDKKNLWAGGTSGLYYYSSGTGVVRFNHDELNSSVVNDLLFEKGKGLWIGTSKGLYLIDEKKQVKHWDVEHGLTNVNVNCLYVQSSSSLWIGTQNGLFNFRDQRFICYKRRNGLIADDVTAFAAISEKELAIGSSKGLTIFYMDEPMGYQRAPDLLIDRMMVNGQPYALNTDVEIPFKNTITLNYKAITFMYPELIAFEYRLNDEPWIPTPNRSLVLTGVKAGEYRLQVRVKKYNSDYSRPVTINLRINTPWWQRWYFYSGLSLSALTLFYLLLSFRLNKQKEAAMIRQELSELKLKALQTQLNPHFISNSLNVIQYYSLKQDELAANQYLTQFADLTRLLLETSRTRFVSLRTELEVLNLYLSLEKMRFENMFEYDVTIDPAINVEETLLPGMLMQPFAENSLNHGMVYLDKSVKGILNIYIRQHQGSIKIIIDDNGIGRARAREIKAKMKRLYRSRSTEIVNEMQTAVNNLPGCFIDIKITDKLGENKEALGTTVAIVTHINPAFNTN